MFKNKNYLLAITIQKLVSVHKGSYNLRGKSNFNLMLFCRNRKGFCVSVSGVRLWNKFSMELKHCPNMKQFKMWYKDTIFKRYRDEGGVG